MTWQVKAARPWMEEYMNSGEDPTSVAVVAEDAAAVSGCFIAAAALTATQLYGRGLHTFTFQLKRKLLLW
jgi:hypothetical protein